MNSKAFGHTHRDTGSVNLVVFYIEGVFLLNRKINFVWRPEEMHDE